MFKHTEVAERLGFTRQALDKHRKQLEQQLGRELGSIQGNARVYSVADLKQLRAQLPESKQAGIDRILSAIAVIEPEIVENSNPAEATSIIPYANGFKAKSALSFTTTNSQETADHIVGEVVESGNAVNQSLQAFFGATQDQDEQLGIYIGAKRLERVFGTADAVFMQGLEQRAKQQGLGKKQDDVQPEAS